MATWAFENTLTLSRGLRQPVILNDKLYFINNIYASYIDTGTTYGQIYEYNPATDTQTLIYTPASHADHYATWSLTAFGSNLYAAIELDHGVTIEGTVLRWDGTADNWTQVYTTGTTDVADGYIRLYFDDTQMVYLGRQFTPTPSYANIARTTSGSSWSAGSISPLPCEPGNGWNSELDDTMFWPLGFYDYFCNSVSGSNCSNSDIYGQSGGGWFVFQAAPAQILVQSSPIGGVHFGGTDNTYEISGDMSTANQLSVDIGASYLLSGITYAIGLKPGINQTELYQYSGSQWTLLETMTADGIHNPEFATGSTWIGNISGAGLLVGSNADSGSVEVWLRSEAFPELSTVAKFYFGQNTPTYRSDLSFSGVNPGAMAISPAGNVVVLGGDEAGAQIAAYSSSPFTAWSDMSDGMTTGTAVTSIKYV